jgi:hypothetical protein
VTLIGNFNLRTSGICIVICFIVLNFHDVPMIFLESI